LSRKLLILGILVILLFISIIIALIIGSSNIAIYDIININSANNDINKKIILDIRLPRILNAVFVGASLSCSGIILQSLLRNNLAESGLLGISAGAGLGAILFFLLPFTISFSFLNPVSFIFAILTTLLIFYIAKGINNKYTNFLSSNKIILAGIAINAFLSSINGFLLLYSGKNVSQIIYWLSGGLSGRGWNEIQITYIFVFIGLIGAVLLSKELNILNLGDELSVTLGLRIKTVQRLSIAVSSLLAASAVSVAGIISFVGLIVPNISKLIIGADNRYSIPCSILLGSIFLVVSDTIARTIISPSEIPVGIVTSFIGAPIFIWLILKKRGENKL
jgi:iron complex transport system permease protein